MNPPRQQRQRRKQRENYCPSVVRLMEPSSGRGIQYKLNVFVRCSVTVALLYSSHYDAKTSIFHRRIVTENANPSKYIPFVANKRLMEVIVYESDRSIIGKTFAAFLI